MLVARNNPILWLLLETIASAPTHDQFGKALSKLLVTRRGKETIESHLRAIYATPCSNCGQMVQPLGFIWEKGERHPSGRVYACPQCGDEGERDITQYDLDNLTSLGALGLHRSRAFQRVLQGGEYEQESIEAALDCYLPRALYVCMTISNRIDRLDLSGEELHLLKALLLIVFDDASSLWHWPSREQRYFQLSVPARFLEKNLWLSLESAPQRWVSSQPKVPISYWPDLPGSSGGISLYNRRMENKDQLFKDEKPQAIATIFPRPNQAFWTLSALWTGWLWGRQAVTPMRSALARRRYDWRWFAQALEAALKDLSGLMDTGTRMFGLLSQAAPNHFLGLLAGANASNFRLQGYAASQTDEISQCVWESDGISGTNSYPQFKQFIREYLETRGEPCDFQQIINNCLSRIAMQGNLPMEISQIEETYFSQVQQQINDIMRNPLFALSFQSSPTSSVRWWLTDPHKPAEPLLERLEKNVREYLLKNNTIQLGELEKQVFAQLPGPNTPEMDALLICVQSYAEEDETTPAKYQLRPSELDSARQKDIEEAISLLTACGKKFGYKSSLDGNMVVWEDKKGQCKYQYFIHGSCNISGILLGDEHAGPQEKILVFPGSRSRWLVYRQQQDARLESAIKSGWHLLKFRYLRWLATRDDIDEKAWKELMDGDPPLWEASEQIQMF